MPMPRTRSGIRAQRRLERRAAKRKERRTARPPLRIGRTPDVGRESRAPQFGMPISPAVVLLALVVLLGLLAACHFFQGRQHKDHASRKGPDE
jgi:hypothetical protein